MLGFTFWSLSISVASGTPKSGLSVEKPKCHSGVLCLTFAFELRGIRERFLLCMCAYEHNKIGYFSTTESLPEGFVALLSIERQVHCKIISQAAGVYLDYNRVQLVIPYEMKTSGDMKQAKACS